MTTAFNFLGAKLPVTDFGGGAGTPLQNGVVKTVNVNMGDVSLLYTVFNNNPMMSTALAQFLRTVLRSNIVIEMVHDDDSVLPFDVSFGRNKVYYDREIYPAIKKMCEDWILYGFTCVSIGRSRVITDAPTLIVLPISEYQCQIVYDEEFRRSYKIAFSKITPSKRTQNLARNARFLCMHEPDDAGNPASPVARCLMRLIYYEKLWHDKVRESHLRTHPPLIFTQEAVAQGAHLKGAEDVSVSEIFHQQGQAPTSVVQQRSEDARHKYTRERMNEAFDNRHKLAVASSKMADNVSDSSSSSSSSLRLTGSALLSNFREYSAFTDGDDPIANQFVAPPGQRFEKAHSFDGVEQFRDIMAMIDENFFNALGLPIENHVYKTEKGMQLMLKKLNTSIMQFHRDSGRLLSEALEPVLKLILLPEISKKTTIQHSEAISDDSDSSSDDDDTTESNPSLKEQIKDAFANTTIQVSFQTVPETTLELLIELRNTDVITRGTYKALARDLAGITTHDGDERVTSEDELFQSEYEDRRQEKRQRLEQSFREPPTKVPRTPNDPQERQKKPSLPKDE